MTALLTDRDVQVRVSRVIDQAVSQSSDAVENAYTLPPAAYSSQDFFNLEAEAIFKRDWLLVAHVSQIPNVGDYVTLELFNEPLIVVRSKEGIRVLSNVCRHRWAPVAQGAGNARAFSCPFHKWTYDLDGQLIGAPLMDRAVDFDKKSCRLPEVKSEVVEELGLVFATFDNANGPITEKLGGLIARARQEGWDMADQQVVHTIDQENRYNWKVQVETYVECYHHIGGHETTLQKMLPAESTQCEEDKGSWTICNVALTPHVDRLNDEEKLAFESFAQGAKPGEVIGHIVVIYPFTLLTFMPGGSDIRVLAPRSPTTTWSRLLVARQREQIAKPGFDEWLAEYNATADIINKEDNDINDMQQYGVASSLAEAGRFSHLEACAWHLAQYVRRKIADYRQAS